MANCDVKHYLINILWHIELYLVTYCNSSSSNLFELLSFIFDFIKELFITQIQFII